MNQDQIRAILTTAASVLASRSKFALFCMDLSCKLYGIEGADMREHPEDEPAPYERTYELQNEYELFWREAYTIRAILGE